MVKPGKAVKQTEPSIWSNRRNIMIAVSVIAAFVLFGFAIPAVAMQLENHDSFCASCHTEGELTFFNRSLLVADKSTDLASFHAAKHAARCIDCHTGPGLIGRFGGLMAGSTDLISYFSGHYPQPAALEAPYPDANCLKCHADLATKQDFKNHFHVFLSQWQTLDPKNAGSCVDCHASHDTTNDTNLMFLNKVKTEETCQKCHAAAGNG
jgi:nitrate/TMAO reductase-like tetraheme cytochrome c subunit